MSTVPVPVRTGTYRYIPVLQYVIRVRLLIRVPVQCFCSIQEPQYIIRRKPIDVYDMICKPCTDLDQVSKSELRGA